MRTSNISDRFIYTTHAWLMQRFLECPCPPDALPTAIIDGVWSVGPTLFFASTITENSVILSCLTTDFTQPAEGGCGWSQARCALDKDSASCVYDNGQKKTATFANNTLKFSDGTQWQRFDGRLSGLWNGPTDVQDYYVIGHNNSDNSIIVWWDSNISHPLWHFGKGTVTGSTVDLLIPDFSKTALVGSASVDWNSITWNANAGTWHRHLSPCLVPECMSPPACPARSLMNPYGQNLECPSALEIESFTQAAENGDIVWHAGPFNWQPENMAPELFDAGIDIVRRMDERFYKGAKNTTTMSVRDVIYVTRSVIPMLHARGITGLTIGSNGADYPPQVPKLHRWADRATGTDVIVVGALDRCILALRCPYVYVKSDPIAVPHGAYLPDISFKAYHPYGYGGYGVSDCAIAPNGVALCTEFRTDNTGPPGGVDDVEKSLNAVRAEFPNAKVITSTFDAFIAEVMPVKDQLPVVETEIGDTWIYGNPSDPLKMAQFRAIQRAWIACMKSGEPACDPSNPVIQNMTWALLKAPEHTWGTPGISGWGGGDAYNVTTFRAQLNDSNFLHATASWAEQRFFNEMAVRALEEAGHPLASSARAELDIIENVAAPDTSEYTSVSATQKITFSGTETVISVGDDGSIAGLEDKGIQWASPTSPLALFTYQTLNETEWKPFTYNYINGHGESSSFCKPGSNDWSESKVWTPTLKQVWVKGSTSAATGVLLELQMPTKSCTVYGSYATVYMNITMARTAAGPLDIDLTLTTLGKQPTMIGESTSISFNPVPKLVPLNSNASAWTIDKLGGSVDPEGVGDGGNQFCHGTWKGVTARTVSGDFVLESLDAINVNPITADFPIGNPLPASYLEADAKAGTGLSQLKHGSVTGMAFNLHNNLWNTNYDLFWPNFDPRFCTTPYDCRTANALWRFKVTLG